TQGFKKELDIVGVGYRAEVKGKTLNCSLGYSHPIVFPIPDGIQITVEKQTHLTVTGADKALVGQVAADLRSLRPPDPYKQKGIRLTGERLKKKAGKAGAAKLIGKAIAERAKAAGIERVVFDRGGYKYHGRVQALAEAAREAGLKF